MCGMQLALAFLLVLQCTAREIITKKYRTPPVKLKSGQIANTPNEFGPFPFPEGKVGITYFKADLVDEAGTSIPLSEVYVHHWLVFAFNKDMTFPLHNPGVCSPLMNVYGIGAELRGTAYQYPEPYALMTTGEEKWTGNLHFIRTTNVPAAGIQDCIECRCTSSDPPKHPEGSVGCCPDGAQCWGMEGWKTNDTKAYYLEYEIKYTTDLTGLKPITVYSFDATAKNTYDCMIDYNVPGPLASGEFNKLQHSSDIPVDMDIVFMQPHQHIGGVNFTIEHISGSTATKVCTAKPVYGTGTEAGNEDGYLVKIPFCEWPGTKPLHVKRGDKFRMTSYYDGRTLKDGHPYHAGVMALLYVHGEAAKSDLAKCLTEMETLCGKAPHSSRDECLKCAEDHQSKLVQAGCTPDMIDEECSQTGGGGDVPVPPALAGMKFNIKHEGDKIHATATGPAEQWWSVAFHPDKNIMDGSTAFVYTDPDGSGTAVLQERVLGNHAAGTVTNNNYPHTVAEKKDNAITIQFTIENWKPGTQNCWLFAQGDVMTGLELQYHGFARGSACGYPPVSRFNHTSSTRIV